MIATPPSRGLPRSLTVAMGAFACLDMAQALEGLYQRLPATVCQRQGHCCGLLPPLAPVEMLAWLARHQAMPTPERLDQVAALLEHFLTNAARRRACPWAGPGACAVYAQRFLACRAHGLWSLEAYDRRRQGAMQAQEAVTRAWAGLGVRLPDQVLAPGPEYCRNVRRDPLGEKHPRVDDSLLESCEADLDSLARRLPATPELAAAGGDLAYLLAGLALGPGQCLAAKVSVTKALLAGQERQAAHILAQAMAAGRAWAATWEEAPS